MPDSSPPKGQKSAEQARAERLARSLRENLKRRKAQLRGRDRAESEGAGQAGEKAEQDPPISPQSPRDLG